MSALLAHRWGESRAVDEVWSDYVGMAPSLLARRFILVIRAFMDESEGGDGSFALAGYVAPVERWAEFTKEWEKMLTLGLRDERGWYFHMNEMAATPERLSRVPGFYRIIEKHAGLALSVRFSVHDLKRARERISVPGSTINWGFVNNPWHVAYRALMDNFHKDGVRSQFAHLIPKDAVVDFIFDDTMNKKVLRDSWDLYREGRSDIDKHRVGLEPRFRDDREFLALQAADFWAWWVRKWHGEGVATEQIRNPDFGSWTASQTRRPGTLDFSIGEDEIAANLVGLLRSMHGDVLEIVDLKNAKPKGAA